MERDPFDVLGLSAGATPAEVRTAFWARARAMHPDRHPGNPAANERFRRIVLAYEDALRMARREPRRARRHHAAPPAPPAVPPPRFRCSECGDGYDYDDTCPRCESIAAGTLPVPRSAHAMGAGAVLMGAVVLSAELRPMAVGAMLVLFGTFLLALALHERLRPALPTV
jgi:hypothetical protein